jgi:hypothetical protein
VNILQSFEAVFSDLSLILLSHVKITKFWKWTPFLCLFNDAISSDTIQSLPTIRMRARHILCSQFAEEKSGVNIFEFPIGVPIPEGMKKIQSSNFILVT